MGLGQGEGESHGGADNHDGGSETGEKKLGKVWGLFLQRMALKEGVGLGKEGACQHVTRWGWGGEGSFFFLN